MTSEPSCNHDKCYATPRVAVSGGAGGCPWICRLCGTEGNDAVVTMTSKVDEYNALQVRKTFGGFKESAR